MENYVIDGKVVNITLENGKVVKASTKYLENMVAKLEIDMDEAVMTWLEDEGYINNDEQEELCIAAKENKVLASLHRGEDGKAKEKVKRNRTTKENPVKEMIITEIFKCINNIDGVTAVTIENKGKIITFNFNNEDFKIDLIQRRKSKNKEGAN